MSFSQPLSAAITSRLCHSLCPGVGGGCYPSMQWVGVCLPPCPEGCLALGPGDCTPPWTHPPKQTPAWTPPLRRHHHPPTPGQTDPPPERWPLKRTVRILVECILVTTATVCLYLPWQPFVCIYHGNHLFAVVWRRDIPAHTSTLCLE